MDHSICQVFCLSTLVGAITGILPPLAALATLIYYVILIIKEVRKYKDEENKKK